MTDNGRTCMAKVRRSLYFDTVAAYVACNFQVDFETGKFRESADALVGIAQQGADAHGYDALVPGDEQWSVQLDSLDR